MSLLQSYQYLSPDGESENIFTGNGRGWDSAAILWLYILELIRKNKSDQFLPQFSKINS